MIFRYRTKQRASLVSLFINPCYLELFINCDCYQTGKRTINTLIFPQKTKLGIKKTLSFKRKEDFVVHFSYNTPVDTP